MPRYVTHLEGAIDGAKLPADQIASLHKDRPILVRYDLPAVRKVVTKETLGNRPELLWRYRELLPHFEEADAVSLGERMTPLLPCPRLGAKFGLENLWIKDESQLPTGSFKSRGMALAITMAKRFGVKCVALPTAGNAGGAAAAYAARAGLECFVFMPEDTPAVNQYECQLAGAKTFLVNGLIGDCGRLVREGQPHFNWFDLSTLKEPYRLEGKKTMGLELAEQSDWKLPDVILYPTGGGTGLVGMWKAFAELTELGWLESGNDKGGHHAPRDDSPHAEREDHQKDHQRINLPRMVAVQSTGCAPIVRAFEAGAPFAAPFANAKTVASGIRVPSAVGDFLILNALRESRGTAIAVEEATLMQWLRLAASLEGIAICPEAAACVGALESLAASGWIQPHERVVLFNTGAAQKYVEAIRCDLPRLDITQPIDWRALDR
jgi:threonine synthase